MTENPGMLRRGNGLDGRLIRKINAQKLLKMVLEPRTEGEYFLGCDGSIRYYAKLFESSDRGLTRKGKVN